jgi:hypothetical protein
MNLPISLNSGKNLFVIQLFYLGWQFFSDCLVSNSLQSSLCIGVVPRMVAAMPNKKVTVIYGHIDLPYLQCL